MILAAVYNVWDCEYLLEKSIQQIYPHVNHIVICWQDVSNFGEFNPATERTVYHLKSKYGNIVFYKFIPDNKYSAQFNEKKKRNDGLEIARQLNCTHYVLMDADEFYIPEEFAEAKSFIAQHKIDSSSMELYSYYKKPTQRLNPIEKYEVPFICRLTQDTKVGDYEFPAYCDPTRKPQVSGKYWAIKQFKMYHYTFCRKDIKQKINNSSAKQNYIAAYGGIDAFVQKFHENERPVIGEFSLIEDEDRFGLVSIFGTQ